MVGNRSPLDNIRDGRNITCVLVNGCIYSSTMDGYVGLGCTHGYNGNYQMTPFLSSPLSFPLWSLRDHLVAFIYIYIYMDID